MRKLLLGALALIMASCSNEESISGPVQEESAIRIDLKMAATGSAGTRSAYDVATEDERTVQTLDAYLFAPTGENSEDYVLEKIYNNLITSSWVPEATEEAKTVSLPGVSRTAKKILFVANGTGITSLGENVVEGETTESAFRTLLMNEMTANPSTPLVMTAETALQADVWKGAALSATAPAAALERVVARIDLVVKDQESVSFVPTRIEMVNARPNSYIFPAEGKYADKTATLKLANAIADGKGESLDGSTAYKSLLFPYEVPATDGVILSVTGDLTVGDRTVKSAFDIPFTDADNKPLSVVRNTCYTVTITRIEGLSAMANITFTVKDWETEEIEHAVEVKNFTLSGDGLTGNRLAIGATKASIVLTVGTNVAWTAAVTKGDDFLTAAAEGDQLTLTATANTTGTARKAYVQLSTTADPNVGYTLVVTQVAQ